MKAMIQTVCAAALLALLLSGCRANPTNANATTETTTMPTAAETTMPETQPTTQPTTEMTTQPTEDTTASPENSVKGRISTQASEYANGRTGLADENGIVSDPTEPMK